MLKKSKEKPQHDLITMLQTVKSNATIKSVAEEKIFFDALCLLVEKHKKCTTIEELEKLNKNIEKLCK